MAGQVLLLAAVYFCAAKASLLLAIPPGYATAVWPPSGIALAAMLLFGKRIWPGIWIGAAATNLSIQGAPLLALLIASGNTLEAVVGAALIRRYIGTHGEFESGEAVFMFVALSALSALIAATIGSVSLVATGTIPPANFSSNAWTWFQGDASGMIILTPLILTWRLRRLQSWHKAQSIEAFGLGLSVLLVSTAIFASDAHLPLAFLPLSFVVWAALRFDQRAVTAVIFAISAIGVLATLKNLGPFAVRSIDLSNFLLLTYTSTLVITGLALSAVIGQRKRAQLAVRSRVEELQSSERYINEFLAMLSHELRNPLAPMVNALALLRRDPGRRQHPPMLAIIERQVEHLSHIVDDLLDVSRITRGKILLHKQIADFSDIVSGALESIHPLIATRTHTVEAKLSAKLFVDADKTRLSQVVLNLINNAAKYTPSGGHIVVSLDRENTDAVLRVRDSGIGITPELLPKVFDLFMQGDRALDRSEGGLGIGLTVAKRIVEMHGGSIVAFSEGPGRGSEFVVRLPLAQAQFTQEPSATRLSGAPAAAASRRRLLVVDDNRDSADTLALLLNAMGHEVKTAYDGPAAIDLAAQYQPQAVLLDIGLPGMNGYEVGRVLKSTRGDSMILVAVSGYGQEEDRRRSREAGFDHHLVKPVAPADLAKIIDALATPV
jgi:signal transduction histidine kinase/CheY-like chemotaxis protein